MSEEKDTKKGLIEQYEAFKNHNLDLNLVQIYDKNLKGTIKPMEYLDLVGELNLDEDLVQKFVNHLSFYPNLEEGSKWIKQYSEEEPQLPYSDYIRQRKNRSYGSSYAILSEFNSILKGEGEESNTFLDFYESSNTFKHLDISIEEAKKLYEKYEEGEEELTDDPLHNSILHDLFSQKGETEELRDRLEKISPESLTATHTGKDLALLSILKDKSISELMDKFKYGISNKGFETIRTNAKKFRKKILSSIKQDKEEK